MAEIGTIEQYKGPFTVGYELNLQGNCKIGISIGEDDFMSWKSYYNEETKKWIQGQDFVFIINNQTIHMGKTYIYETDSQINNTIIHFPDGAPLSTIVNVVYCETI